MPQITRHRQEPGIHKYLANKFDNKERREVCKVKQCHHNTRYEHCPVPYRMRAIAECCRQATYAEHSTADNEELSIPENIVNNRELVKGKYSHPYPAHGSDEE